MGVRGNGEEGSREDDEDVCLTPPPLLRWEETIQRSSPTESLGAFKPARLIREVESGGRCCEKKDGKMWEEGINLYFYHFIIYCGAAVSAMAVAMKLR